METFKKMVDNCQMMKENGTEACTCWSNSNFTALAATIRLVDNVTFCHNFILTIRKCKISSSQKAVIAQLSSCKGNFSACKQVTFTFHIFTFNLIPVSLPTSPV